MSDLFDIVDENDQVIGRSTWEECHTKHLLHRAAAIFIFKDLSYKELLIQKRSKFLKVQPQKWSQVGGFVDSGETYLECVSRELKEEMFCNMELPSLKFEKLFKIRKFADGDNEFFTLYRAVYIGEFSLDPKEVENYKYKDIVEITNDINANPQNYSGTFKVILDEYKKRFLD